MKFGRAEEAIGFYSSVFDHSSTERMVKYPEDHHDSGKVMYSEFNLNHYSIIAMDGQGVHDYTFNEAVSFVVSCQTQEEIDFYWNNFTNGGKESQCG